MARPPRDTPAAHPEWPGLTFPLHYRQEWQPGPGDEEAAPHARRNAPRGRDDAPASPRLQRGEHWPTFGPQSAHATRPPSARPMRNRGPRGYVRPDARIEEEAYRALRAEGEHFDDVHIVSSNGHVRLSGTVPLRRHRYVAEDIVADLPFVNGIQNDIDVER